LILSHRPFGQHLQEPSRSSYLFVSSSNKLDARDYFKLSRFMLDVSEDAEATADELEAAMLLAEKMELFWLSIFLAKLLTVCEESCFGCPATLFTGEEDVDDELWCFSLSDFFFFSWSRLLSSLS
jgi:hypothetical protein